MAPAVRAGWIISGFLSGILVIGYGNWIPAAAFFAVLLLFLPERILMIACGFAAGVFYYAAYFGFVNARMILPPINSEYSASVVSDPSPAGKAFRTRISFLPPYRGEAELFTGRTLEYGEIIKISKGGIQPGIRPHDSPRIVFPNLAVSGRTDTALLASFLRGTKAAFFRPLERALPPKESAFLKGLLFGDTEDFPADFRQDMRRSGTTHLVALSGYNIALVASFITWLFGAFLSPRWMFTASAGAISAFVLMTGGEPSVLRAAIMGIMLILSRLLGRVYSFGHAVLWTAAFLALWDPAIMFSIGFQLSFASLLGISFLPRAISGLFGWIEAEKEIWSPREVFLTAASAYASALPLTISFGGISAGAIPANIMLLPFIPPTMLLGFAAGAAAAMPFLGFALARMLEVLLALELFAIRLFALLPNWDPGGIPFYGICAYYVALLIFARKYALKDNGSAIS